VTGAQHIMRKFSVRLLSGYTVRVRYSIPLRGLAGSAGLSDTSNKQFSIRNVKVVLECAAGFIRQKLGLAFVNFICSLMPRSKNFATLHISLCSPVHFNLFALFLSVPAIYESIVCRLCFRRSQGIISPISLYQ